MVPMTVWLGQPASLLYKGRAFSGAMPEETKDSSRTAIALFYAAILAGALTLYIAWGMMYGAWNLLSIDNIAIYSIFIVMAGAGIAGILLYGGKHEIK
jgi:hypothetical protein